MTHPPRLALATKNLGKIREILRICAAWPVEWLTADAPGSSPWPDVQETGESYLDNALLSEATWLRRPKDVPMALHITAAEAGEHAARAGVGRLILTHIWPTNDRTVAVEEAERAFKQGVVSAEEGMVFRL